MTKKVIEPVVIEQKKHTSFELIENDNGDLGIRTIVALFTLEKEFRTTVAKAIDPEYQKVIDELEFLRAEHPVNIAIRNENKNLIDQNAKLVEAVEWINVKDKLPQDMEEVMFSNVNIKDLQGNEVEPSVITGYYLCNGVFRSWLSTDNFTATYWMPLPKPPTP